MAQRDFYISEEAYLALEEASPDIRYEYSDGQIRMLAGQSANHAIVNDNIGAALRDRIRGSGCQQLAEMRFNVTDSKYYYPDRAVICDKRDQKAKIVTIKYPCLVFEILSPSTESTDRAEKAQTYQAHPFIQEYVFVHPDKPHVEVYRRGGIRQWVMDLYQLGDTIELRSINASIPIEEFYEDIYPLEIDEEEE